MPKTHAPISAIGFDGLQEWRRGGRPVCLTLGLPHNNIVAATVLNDGSVAVTFTDRQRLRNPRIFDPAGFYLARLLVLPGNSLYIERALPGLRDYPAFGHEGIPFLRIIADAQPDQVIQFVGDHHNCRLRNLKTLSSNEVRDTGKETKATYTGREEAANLAAAAFDKALRRDKLKHLPSVGGAAHYETLIFDAYALHDERCRRDG